ncbi:hypothetical protein U91I_02000 [alpha proteobacterium U9-1i]|nr:hypothetical protein U91I_02000 [alpha proteobacterium U9-1i]
MAARLRSRRIRSACWARNFAAAEGAGPGCSAARRILSTRSRVNGS